MLHGHEDVAREARKDKIEFSFASDPLDQVNSPVEVLVNGAPVAAVNKIGWPGETEFYRVDFRLPDGISGGATTLRLVAAWIPGSEFNLAVR